MGKITDERLEMLIDCAGKTKGWRDGGECLIYALEELQTLRQKLADGRLHESVLAVGQKLYEPDTSEGVRVWDVTAVDIGGCAGETWLCERDTDNGVETHVFELIDLNRAVFQTPPTHIDIVEEKDNG